MKAYQISKQDKLYEMNLNEIPEPEIGPNDVLIDMKAWSLNYRDLSMLRGGYYRNDKVKTNPPLIPLSDGAGEVVSVGNSVTRFKKGDRVAGIFFQTWISGDLTDEQIGSALGGAIDGVLAEKVVLNENGVVKIPDNLNYHEAATLPCAAVTAWQALNFNPVKPDDTVLMLGTGGVSIFALQFVKAEGAKAIITSSSDEKLEMARKLGADHTINYKEHPDWEKEVLKITDGQGVDNVIEVGGAGTLEKSITSAKVSGRISLIGVLSGQPEQNPSPVMIMLKRLTLQGIYVGSRDMFESMNKVIEANDIKPVIGKTFEFENATESFDYLKSGSHFGKIVIS
ncbi:MAG TPA: NAD(P)-dependent alcohol dehydrogenase [Thermodesulfobacteriota bacterium]|nr:NAD(P)-dependent alcohol dehydrogenase [Thermodesulfobacteriota bacterium]